MDRLSLGQELLVFVAVILVPLAGLLLIDALVR